MDKELLEGCLKLADAAWRDLDKRRSYEWRINFALWTALAVFAGLGLKGEIDLASPFPLLGQAGLLILLLLLLAFIGFVYISWWTAGIQDRNKKDRLAANFYWNKIDEELKTGYDKETRAAKEEGWWENWSHRSQVAITLVFLIIAALSAIRAATAGPSGTKGSDMRPVGVSSQVVYLCDSSPPCRCARKRDP
jgi:heme A synthase